MGKRHSFGRLVASLLLVVMLLPNCIRVYAANGGDAEVVQSKEEFIQVIYDNLLNKSKTFSIIYNGEWEDIYNNDLDKLFQEVCLIDDEKTTDDFDYMKGNIKKYSLNLSSNGIRSEFLFSVVYRESKAQTEKVNATVKRAIKKMKLSKASDYTKVKKIHDYIVNRATYDTGYSRYTAYDAIVRKKAVCQGYALLFYKMTSEVGIPCRVITSSDHAWNIVKIGKKWYNVDCTWDDPVSSIPILRYDYFLKGSDSMKDTHIVSPEYRTRAFKKAYPISATDYKVKK